jgi:hypothetical protein
MDTLPESTSFTVPPDTLPRTKEGDAKLITSITHCVNLLYPKLAFEMNSNIPAQPVDHNSLDDALGYLKRAIELQPSYPGVDYATPSPSIIGSNDTQRNSQQDGHFEWVSPPPKETITTEAPLIERTMIPNVCKSMLTLLATLNPKVFTTLNVNTRFQEFEPDSYLRLSAINQMTQIAISEQINPAHSSDQNKTSGGQDITETNGITKNNELIKPAADPVAFEEPSPAKKMYLNKQKKLNLVMNTRRSRGRFQVPATNSQLRQR